MSRNGLVVVSTELSEVKDEMMEMEPSDPLLVTCEEDDNEEGISEDELVQMLTRYIVCIK